LGDVKNAIGSYRNEKVPTLGNTVLVAIRACVRVCVCVCMCVCTSAYDYTSILRVFVDAREHDCWIPAAFAAVALGMMVHLVCLEIPIFTNKDKIFLYYVTLSKKNKYTHI